LEKKVMAKRRNLKKEKAERNQLYARQFRKKTNQNFSRGRRFSGGFGAAKKTEQDEDQQ
jgi:hypothetical protein